MGKVKKAASIVLGLVLVIIFAYFIVSNFKPKVAGIYIETVPAATVYIDGIEEGRTPYDEKTRKPGEVTIKLIPDSFDKPLAPYETRINLVAGVQTVVKRDFGETDEQSSGEIISFEEIEKNQTSLAVVSVPDSAELIIDANQHAFTPHRTTSLSPGIHTLTIKSDGYREKNVEVRTHEGYKLTAVIKLAKDNINNLEESEEGEAVVDKNAGENDLEKVVILSTPTGFLRVREEPSTLAEEVGTVEPGKEYELLEKDENTGWYKINFSEENSGTEKEGWISNQYAKVVNSVSPTPQTTPKPTS